MPKLYVYGTDRQKTTKLTIAFARGVIRHNNAINGPWQVKHLPITNYLELGFPSDVVAGQDAVATLGVLRGTGLMLKSARAKGIDYYYMDHAYFMPGYGGKGWMRISKNSHTCTTLREVSKDKWNGFHKNYGYQCEKWKNNNQRGRDILVLPPTGAVSWFFDQGKEEWLDNTISELKSLLPESEHYRIKIRRKPKEPVEMEGTSTVSLVPSFMIVPSPKSFSICLSAVSNDVFLLSAIFFLSSVYIYSTYFFLNNQEKKHFFLYFFKRVYIK